MADPDRMRFVSRGGGSVLFGVLFLAAGLWVLSAPLQGVELSNGRGESASPLLFVIFGGGFAVVGGAIVLARRVIEIDRRRQEFISWRGAGVPFRREVRSLAGYDWVTITSEVRGGRRRTYTVYSMTLGSITVQEFEADEVCRREAEVLAKFLRLGLMDTTLRAPNYREAGTLDLSLRDRLRNESPPVPALPFRSRISYRRDGRTSCVVEIPPAGLRPLALALTFLAPTLLVVLGYPQLSASVAREGWCLWHVVPLALGVSAVFVLGVLPLFLMVRRATTRERLTITPDAISLQQTWILSTRERSVAMDALEEVEIAKATPGQRSPFDSNGSVRLRSDRSSIDVGRALSLSEQAWLRALIHYAAATGCCPEQLG